MESNKDEAIKCLLIAQRHRDAGNFPSARKFCQKSISLFSTPEALKLLESIMELENSTSSSSSSSGPSSSSAEPHPSASGSRHRHTSTSTASSKSVPNGTAGESSSEKREYTAEQAEIVKRIRSCKVTEYYEIMSLKKDCGEVEVKKAYRKLALQLHPDKNGAPGADEAFKMVSKAFQILSDPDKRTMYDRHGSDPDSRFGGMSSTGDGPPGFAGHPFANGSFDGEISPEDLFNMFFGGGGMGGSPFGGPAVFTTSFGPGGFRTTRVHMGGRRPAGQAQQSEMSLRTMLTQLAPLLILFLFTFLSAVPSLFSSSGIADPTYSFARSARFNSGRQTQSLHVNYFVNQAEFATHPIGVELSKLTGAKNSHSSLLDRFEQHVEQSYKGQMYALCQREQERQQRRKEQKMGFMGFGTDWDAIKAINAEKIESCEELNRLYNAQ